MVGACGELLLEFVGAGAERFVGQRLQLRFERVDLVDARLIGADPPIIGGTEQLAGDSADHRINILLTGSRQRP